MDRPQTPPVITTDFFYLRLIGDRSIQESNFGKLQRDRSLEMKGWADKVTQLKEDEKSLKIGIVAANNHYGGFGPGTAKMFREMLNLEPKSVDHIDLKEIGNQLDLEKKIGNDLIKCKEYKQTTMSDFV
jgi:uncharacterized protein YecE (DUF72 family)